MTFNDYKLISGAEYE